MKRIILIVSLVLVSCGAFAQHDHGSHDQGSTTHSSSVQKPPHGGQLNQVGKYKVEMVTDFFLKKDQLTFYVFKNNMKPLSKEPINGNITIHYNDGTTVSASLQEKGSARFVAQLDRTKSFHCEVELLVGGKKVNTDFSQEGMN